MGGFKCKKCRKIIYNYSTSRKVRNWCKDQKVTNKHCRMHHQVESSMFNTIEENEVNETSKISLVIDAGFDAQDMERESHHVTYLSDLRNEDEK